MYEPPGRSGASTVSHARQRMNNAMRETEATTLVIAATLGKVLFPVLSVDLPRARDPERAFVEAARVDAVAVGMRARHVERLDAAVPAEKVLRGAGVELVGRERLLAREK